MPDLTTTAGPDLAAEFLEEAQQDAPYRALQDAEFEGPEGDESDYLAAPDLAALTGKLIGRWPELSHLKNVEIVFLWKRKGGVAKGQLTLGRCAKATGLIRYLSESAYVIWLAADHVRDLNLSNRAVEAALYHELSHTADDLSVVGHDVEMFGAEVTRYGLWREPLKIAKRAFEQLPLFGETERAER